MRITALFTGIPNDPMDQACKNIFEDHGGKFSGSGTFLANSERDIQYWVPKANADKVKAALVAAGFRIAE